MKNPFLIIKNWLRGRETKNHFLVIKIGTPIPDVGPSVSIHWKDSDTEIIPPMDADESEKWDRGDQAWTKICNGIHALIGELGPLPEGGWDVEFTCSNPSSIIEEGLTIKQYHDRK